MRNTPRITLYSAQNCPHCKQARQFLESRGIAFQELDVGRSPKARKQLERLGARGVPVIMVGQQRLDGFRPDKLKQLLKKAGIAL